MFKRPDAPPGSLGWGSLQATLDRVAAAVRPGPYLLGERFTAADVVMGSGVIWGMAVGSIPPGPEFEEYKARLVERPALQRTFAKDAELASPS